MECISGLLILGTIGGGVVLLIILVMEYVQNQRWRNSPTWPPPYAHDVTDASDQRLLDLDPEWVKT